MIFLLELVGVSKIYRDNAIFGDLSFCVQGGECLGIVGENGCGKSTLLRIVAGVDRSFTGDIRINGRSILGDKNIIRKKFAYVPQEDGLADFLTAGQQLEFWQKAIGQKNDEVLELLDIAKIAKKPISTLSGGQRKRLSIAMALQSEAQYIIMDEAFAALDTHYRGLLSQYIKNKVRSGATALWCSHEHSEIADMCSRYIKIKNGDISSQK